MDSNTSQLSSTAAIRFVTAGNATITLVSLKTGARYTYQIRESELDQRGRKVWFVGLLTGSDNETSYSYIGIISQDMSFRTTAKTRLPISAPSVVAFGWTWNRLTTYQPTNGLEIWHSGKCGRCGRKLTVPESIASGFGPECSEKLAA